MAAIDCKTGLVALQRSVTRPLMQSIRCGNPTTIAGSNPVQPLLICLCVEACMNIFIKIIKIFLRTPSYSSKDRTIIEMIKYLDKEVKSYKKISKNYDRDKYERCTVPYLKKCKKVRKFLKKQLTSV